MPYKLKIWFKTWKRVRKYHHNNILHSYNSIILFNMRARHNDIVIPLICACSTFQSATDSPLNYACVFISVTNNDKNNLFKRPSSKTFSVFFFLFIFCKLGPCKCWLWLIEFLRFLLYERRFLTVWRNVLLPIKAADEAIVDADDNKKNIYINLSNLTSKSSAASWLSSTNSLNLVWTDLNRFIGIYTGISCCVIESASIYNIVIFLCARITYFAAWYLTPVVGLIA